MEVLNIDTLVLIPSDINHSNRIKGIPTTAHAVLNTSGETKNDVDPTLGASSASIEIENNKKYL